MWQLITGPIIEAVKALGGSWMENRKVKAEGKIKITHAKIDARIKRYEAKAAMDLSAQVGMQYSWKDEYWSLVFGTILIACFLPWTQPYVEDGFIFLKASTPDWFSWCIMGIITATFGLRTWQGWKK